MLENTAERILVQNPDPAVRLRLLRDVLRRPADCSELALAREDLSKSGWVQDLEREQWSDGSWGRLHSMDTSAGQRIPTTEAGVARAVALGLDADHPVLMRASRHLIGILETGECRDRSERNDRWPTGVRLFAASTLAQIDPDLPQLDEIRNLWTAIAVRTLKSGEYDPEAEIAAHRELTGASVKNSYLTLSNRYALSLLGSHAERLPSVTERALVRWIWRKERGIRYLDAELSHPPHTESPGPLERWFTSLEIMSAFPSSQVFGKDAMEWLLAQRNEQGLWDFGPRCDWSPYLPLSETWRRPLSRQHDWSTRVLALLRSYHSAGGKE